MIIRSIIPHLVFQVECKDNEIIEASDLANQLAEKIIKKDGKPINQKFPNLQVMKLYLEAL